tara:strand:- start:553 stop:813 length:261 start_codon:yes stop_codon:yes gene_type:complete
MFDWGCAGREWFKDRIKDFEVFERWCCLHNIDVDCHYDFHIHSFDVQLFIAIELGLDSVWVELLEAGEPCGLPKVHQYCIEIDLVV